MKKKHGKHDRNRKSNLYGIRIILCLMNVCLIIIVLSKSIGNMLSDKIYNIISIISDIIIIILTISTIIIRNRLKKIGIRIYANVEKYIFSRRNVYTYRVNYTFDEKIYNVKVSGSPIIKNKEIEIIISKKYPRIIIDEFSCSWKVNLACILFILCTIFDLLLLVIESMLLFNGFAY